MFGCFFPPTSGEDAWVHEGGHAEVGQDKQEDDSIVDGDSHGEVLRQPRAAGRHTRHRGYVTSMSACPNINDELLEVNGGL